MERRFDKVLITGASSGLGRGLAGFFARRGARVYAAARRMPELESLRVEMQGQPGSVEPFPLDVGRTEETLKKVRALDEECGGLDLVVANAGVSQETDARRLQWENLERVVRVNVLGAAATLTAVLPAMVRRGTGHIAGVSSLAGFNALPSYGAYCASKAFLTQLLESLRMDLSGTDVRVTVIHPGFVKSEMTAANLFPMPFLMETHDAVERMGQALLRGDAELSFPWPLASAARVARFLPSVLLNLAAGRLKPAGGTWKASPLHREGSSGGTNQ
jgi:short-subunit dehydrogenase